MFRWLLIGALAFILIGCCNYSARVVGQTQSMTGKYRLIKTTPRVVQEVFEGFGGDPRLEVDACTVWCRGEIWYCTERGLRAELRNIQSYRNLREAAIRDRAIVRNSQIANP